MSTDRPNDPATTETEKRAKRSPLYVMLENMQFWQQRVDSLTLELETSLLAKDDRTYQKQLAKKILKALSEAREISQRYAVTAAHYVHAKHKPVPPRDKPAITEVTLKLPPLIEGEDRSYREGYEEYAPPGSKTK